MSFFGSKKYGSGNDKWLDSRHGVDVPKTGTLKLDAFNVDEGYVPSGTPVVEDSEGYLIPAANAAPTGFVLGDFPVDGSLDGVGLPVGYIWHGRIKTNQLPVENFTVPAEPGQFSYVGGNQGADSGAGEEG